MIKDTRERGSVIIFVAIAMVAILTMAAIVLDLGYTRATRRDARLAADAGATSGALALSGSSAPSAVCADALAYTAKNLGFTQDLSSQISSACNAAGFNVACATGSSRTASLSVGSTTVKVTNPVSNASGLMNATSLGSGVSQTVTAADGTECERVGVEITQPQSSVFRGITSGGATTFTVHSVARYGTVNGNAVFIPGLVALNPHSCAAIDAGKNGSIILLATAGLGPGVAYSDSDGIQSGGSCSSTNPILASKSSGRLLAESFNGIRGQLRWYKTTSPIVGYNTSSTVNSSVPATYPATIANYVGQLSANSERFTRTPVDTLYHCTVVTPLPKGCTTTTDPIQAIRDLAANPGSLPTTYSGPCDTTSGLVRFQSPTHVTCPTFTVKGGILAVDPGVTVVFDGNLSVEANGTVLVNNCGPNYPATCAVPSLDGAGYPKPIDATKSTTLIVKSTASDAINVQSTSSTMTMAQTTIYNFGGVNLQGSPAIHWTPPPGDIPNVKDGSLGSLNGLLYWGESPQRFSIQGGPLIKAQGILFHGNGQLFGGGGGTIDLTGVQAWVDTAATSGSTTIKLAPNPTLNITKGSASTSLIR